MLQNKKRKEVTLDNQTLSILEYQAKREGRNLKNYLEHILYQKAHNFQITEDYKAMMDDILLKHQQNEIQYIPWDEVKNNLIK
jgi:hypothetical protein